MAQPTEPSKSEIRSRLRAWIEYLMDDLELTTDQAFADAIHVSRPTITNILNEKRPTGILTFMKMHLHLGAQYGYTMERMMYGEPPKSREQLRRAHHIRAPAKNQA